MENKIEIPLTSGEWNVVIYALLHKTEDRNNSPKAKQQYIDLYRKLITERYGEGSAVI
jgi:hypothetical protein